MSSRGQFAICYRQHQKHLSLETPCASGLPLPLHSKGSCTPLLPLPHHDGENTSFPRSTIASHVVCVCHLYRCLVGSLVALATQPVAQPPGWLWAGATTRNTGCKPDRWLPGGHLRGGISDIARHRPGLASCSGHWVSGRAHHILQFLGRGGGHAGAAALHIGSGNGSVALVRVARAHRIGHEDRRSSGACGNVMEIPMPPAANTPIPPRHSTWKSP